MHPRARGTAPRLTAALRRITLAPFLALVVVGALVSWGASESLTSVIQRHGPRGGPAGRSVSLRGSRTPTGWPCASTGLAQPTPTAIASGSDWPTVHTSCVEARSSRDPDPWSAGVAITARPVRLASSPGLPAPSSRAPPAA